MLPLKSLEERVSLLLLASPGSWQNNSNLWLHVALFPLSVSKFPPFLRTPVMLD